MTRIKALLLIALTGLVVLLLVRQVVRYGTTVSVGEKTYQVVVSRSEFEHNRGLSGRTSLDLDTGMLFIFRTPDRYSFWMKDMLFPIDIVWADKDKSIIFMKENARPEDYPSLYTPEKEALYVLEISSGEIARNNFALGQKINISIAK